MKFPTQQRMPFIHSTAAGRGAEPRMLPPGQHAAPARRFGLPQSARWQPPPGIEPSLHIRGEVREPTEMTWRDLLAAVPYRKQTSDLHCVTTWSTRDFHWGGLPFTAVLDILTDVAQPAADAGWLTLTGLDGFRSCLALQDARDGGVLLADRLNGRPLPVAHGAPIRLVAPSQYGYKNVKHLASINFHREYRAGTAGLTEHPRARVQHEERSPGMPGWVYRSVYRALLPLARLPYRHQPESWSES